MDKEKKIEEMSEVGNPKPRFKDRISESYPDMAKETDDDLEALYNRYADDKENELSGMKDNLQIIEDMMSADEDLRAVLTDMIVNKSQFREAIYKFMSPDDLTALPTDADYEAVNKAYNERLERGKSQAALIEQINKNEEKTYENFEAFVAEKGLSEEQAQKLNDTIGDVFEKLLYKEITPEMLEMFSKAMNYDDDVAKASSEGEIRGRNSAIEAKRVANESKKGDGIPNIVGGGSEPINQDDDRGAVSFLGKKRNNI